MTVSVSDADLGNSKSGKTTRVKGSIRFFSIFATMIMLLTGFQLLAMPGSATVTDAISDDAADSTPYLAQQMPEEGPSVEASPGMVDSYSSPTNPYITVSDAAEPQTTCRLTESDGILLFETYYGTYAVDKKMPGRISLLSPEGEVLTSESYFTVGNSLCSLLPANMEIFSSSNDSLHMTYNLVSDVYSGVPMGEMGVDIDFSGGRVPKITARVVGDVKMSDWQIFWRIAMPDYSTDIRLKSGEKTTPFSLMQTDEKVADTAVAVDLSSEARNDSQAGFIANWSDAKDGLLGACKGILSNGTLGIFLQVEFEKGKALIDPSIVSTVTAWGPTITSTQRKTFYSGGYYWVFYYRGGANEAICYKNSSDGITWNGENALPNTAMPVQLDARNGFDVAMRNGIVALTWYSKSANNYYFKSGNISGNKIQWSVNRTICTNAIAGSPCVAIANDSSYWCVYFKSISSVPKICVKRSLDMGVTWQSMLETTTYQSVSTGRYLWAMLMPTENGNISLLEASYVGGYVNYDQYVRIRYCLQTGWTSPMVLNIGVRESDKYGSLSAIATSEGNIHIVTLDAGAAYTLRYTMVTPSGASNYITIANNSQGYPTISLDSNGFLHVFDLHYWNGYRYVRHQSKPLSASYTAWSAKDIIYAAPSGIGIEGIASWTYPSDRQIVVWTDGTTPYTIKFASIPLPYGTPGAPSDPWSREGARNTAINIGSGLLAFTQTDVSVPGRGAIDLSIGRLYQQPKYFYQKNSTPFGAGKYPFCNIGKYWSLNLPWIDGTYICLPGGERFIIQWGNIGKSGEFENHYGTHFTLRSVTKSSVSYIELIMPSGLRYNFSAASPYQLRTITDLKGYDPNNSTFVLPYNCIEISYDGSNHISSMKDRALGRYINFTYNASNVLTSISRPDGETIDFTYMKYNGEYYLSSTTDPLGRSTMYAYDSNACYLLKKIIGPTEANSSYSYARDNSSSTETYSWYVTKTVIRDDAAGNISSQTVIDYKIVNGKIIFARLTDKNATDATQGSEECIFVSALQYSNVKTENALGVQMSQERTWYDNCGQPVRVDHYKGSSDETNYTTYANYDDWGNLIFSKDAMGHETYYSYYNASTQNSFQGGNLLTRTSAGERFYDSFDDWNISDWTQCIGSGSSVSLNSSAFPSTAPALNLEMTNSSGGCYIDQYFESDWDSYYFQATFMTTTTGLCYIGISNYSSAYIAVLKAEDNKFYCSQYIGHHAPFNWVEVADYSLSTTYDIGFNVTPDEDEYDVYIDGIYKTSITQTYRGNPNRIFISQAEIGSTFIDNIRIYNSLNVIVTDLPEAGYIAELYDGNGAVLDRTRSLEAGSMTLRYPNLTVSAPPAQIRITEVAYSGESSEPIVGICSFGTPIGDVWGGDVYSYSGGVGISGLPKSTSRYGCPGGQIYCDEYFSGTPININDNYGWANSSGYAVSGNMFHISEYKVPVSPDYNATHCHGFKDSNPTLTIYSSSSYRLISQYVWLTPGKVPQEIMLQYQVYGAGVPTSWRRAYWGGDSNGNDMINIDYAPTVTKRIGDVPQIFGRWIELTIKPSDLGITSTTLSCKGVIYGLYGGTAMWDCTSVNGVSTQLRVTQLVNGQSIRLELDNGTKLTQIATGGGGNPYKADFDLYSAGIRVFPVSGRFTILNGTAVRYMSPRFEEIWMGDEFENTSSDFYPNKMKGFIHNRLVGVFTYQDEAQSIEQQSYFKYDYEGNLIESKTKNGSGWAYSQAGYDQYGNQLWSSDPTGRMIVTEYSSTYGYAYPLSTGYGGRKDNFEFDTSWSITKGGSGGYSYWLDAKYSTEQFHSSSKSIRLNFSNGPSNYDTCTIMMWKSYKVNPVATLSVQMYLATYSHDNGLFGEYMHSGICMRLYNSNGINYANYTYWLTCWSYNGDNATTSDPNIKVICGKPTMSTWISRVLYPSTDWTNINWNSCYNVTFQLFVISSGAHGDSFKVYYDDFTYDDYAKNSKTTYNYDTNRGLLLSSTDPLGHVTSTQYDLLGRTIRTSNSDNCTYKTATYDDANNKVTLLDEMGHKTVQYYDALGRQTKVERYNITSSTLYSTEGYAYDWRGNVIAYNNSLGFVSTSSYDYLGRLIEVVNPDGTLSTVSYNDQANIATSIDANGNKMAHVYDDLGRLTETREYYSMTTSFRDDFGSSLYAKDGRGWYYSWSATTANGTIPSRGQVGISTISTKNISRTAQLFDTSSLPDNCNIIDAYIAICVWDKTSGTFDVVVQHNATNAKPSNPVVNSDYNKAYYSGNGGSLPNSAIVNSKWNDIHLNSTGIGWINKTGTSKFMLRTSFDINNQSQTSSRYVAWRGSTWSSAQRVRLNVTYTLPNCYQSTTMTYDAAGNLLTVTAANGNVTSMSYDPLNRLTQTTYPDGYSEHAAYDLAGRAINKTARSGQNTTSSYDSSGKPFRIESRNDTISYLFDADGKTVRTKNNYTTIFYGYNAREEMTSMSEVIAGNHTIYYGYDSDGKLSWIKYPNQVNVSYGYDVFDRTIKVEKNDSMLLTINYNLDNTVRTENTTGGQSTSYSYNNRGWTTKIETKNGTNVVLSMNYTYDGVGNVRSINYSPGVTEYYYYDSLSRLTHAIGTATWGTIINYIYDSVGNRLWKNESGNIGYTYGAYNKLVKDKQWNYSYNSNGDLTLKSAAANNTKYIYAFNSLGQMTNAYKDVGPTRSTLGSYFYDGNGARAKTVENSITTEYVYIGHDPICEKSSDAYTDYVYVNGRMNAKIIGNDVYFYIDDALGSTRIVYKGSVQVFKATTYKPFGIVYGVTGSEKFTFAGEMKDSTGLFYLFARNYDAEIGRFVSMDPVLGEQSLPSTLNRYAYCGNNPLINTDPTGLFFPLGALFGGIIGFCVGVAVSVATGGDLQNAFCNGLNWGVTCAMIGSGIGVGFALSKVATGMAVNAATNAATCSLDSMLHGESWDTALMKACQGALIGVIAGGAGALAGKYLPQVITAMKGIAGCELTMQDILGKLSQSECIKWLNSVFNKYLGKWSKDIDMFIGNMAQGLYGLLTTQGTEAVLNPTSSFLNTNAAAAEGSLSGPMKDGIAGGSKLEYLVIRKSGV